MTHSAVTYLLLAFTTLAACAGPSDITRVKHEGETVYHTGYTRVTRAGERCIERRMVLEPKPRYQPEYNASMLAIDFGCKDEWWVRFRGGLMQRAQGKLAHDVDFWFGQLTPDWDQGR